MAYKPDSSLLHTHRVLSRNREGGLRLGTGMQQANAGAGKLKEAGCSRVSGHSTVTLLNEPGDL